MRTGYGQNIPYSGKFLRVQTFAKTPPETPEEIFAVLIFVTKPCIVWYQLVCKTSMVFIFAVVGLSAKTTKVCTMQKLPAIRYMYTWSGAYDLQGIHVHTQCTCTCIYMYIIHTQCTCIYMYSYDIT